jgi:hypothetical protein
MPTPREVFDENMRPAELLVCIHTLLENDRVHSEGELITRVRDRLLRITVRDDHPYEAREISGEEFCRLRIEAAGGA